MGLTKNKQTDKNIIVMAREAFPDKGVPEIQELTEGMCNAAYKLTYEDGFQTVLKISSPLQTGFMTNEAHLMEAEVRAMRLVSEHTDIKVAEIYRYDTSKRLCDGDYFFMECLDGASWISVIDNLEDSVNSELRKKVGKLQKQLSKVKSDKFGLLGEETRFDSLYEFTYFLIDNVLNDAEKRDVVIGVPRQEILAQLQKEQNLFEEIKVATLVHWDMWEGNIFVKDGCIAGIIDWERAMWGEPFMDDRFRYHNRHDDFLNGFGINELSEEELRRIYWYDILLYLTMMTEVTYREYEDDGQYQWVKPMFDKIWRKLNIEKHSS
jgi:aminoglycoside phosphotransferase (APT) family kinase protein